MSAMMTKTRINVAIVTIVALYFMVYFVDAASATTIRVAVAANFTAAAQQIANDFEKHSGHQVKLSFASSGQLFAQISQGAPYDVFLSADQQRPLQAEQSGLAVPGSRVTYALGKLALFSMNATLVKNADSLKNAKFNKLAIANPSIAPYGAAAESVLRALNLYSSLKPRIVQGNNIAQTYQFVQSENAELGFVALSQIIAHNKGSRWIVPQQYYPPIAQDAVLLSQAKNNRAAQQFLDYLVSDAAKVTIHKQGYDTTHP